MTRTKRIEQCIARAGSADWQWLLLCLLAAVAILLSLAQSVPAHAQYPQGPEQSYVTNSVDTDPDCDQSHGLAIGHCHATATCSAYAQLETGAVACAETTNGHPLPIAQGVCIGQTLRPNLQPPKHSSQA